LSDFVKNLNSYFIVLIFLILSFTLSCSLKQEFPFLCLCGLGCLQFIINFCA
jgi:hypothetical protein